MTTKQLFRTSGLAALAAAMAVSVLPAESFAKDAERGWLGGDRGSSRSSQSSPRAERSSPRSEARSEQPAPRAARSEGRSESRGPAPQARVADAPRPERAARDYTPPRQVAVPASQPETRAPRQSWTGRGDSARTATPPAPASTERNRTYTGGDRDQSYGAGRSAGGNPGGDSWAERRGLPDQRSGNDRGGRDGDRSRSWVGRDGDGRDGDRDGDRRGRDGNGRDGDRNGGWNGRDGNRDGNWGDRDGRGRDGRDGDWRDRDGRDGSRGDHRRWDNRWRDNDRYNWRHYRESNRTAFHLGIYYAPYRNYYYSRIGVGFYLDSLFFSSRYWIADPWQYRLPEVYGPYRWVRYYDDVVLVDIYTGEVVDVIYDFFW